VCRQLNVRWNNVYRRESVKELQFWCGRLDFKHIYFKRKLAFVRKMRDMFNPVVQTCFTAFQSSVEFYNLIKMFNCADEVCSVGHITDSVFIAFNNLVFASGGV